MKKSLILAIFTITVLASAPSFAGNCDYSTDRASDGSRCGGRAADQRDGGYDPSPYNPRR